MTINNHFAMEIIHQLNNELLKPASDGMPVYPDELNYFKDIARSYACTEQAIAVLSDMHTDTSYIYYGKFAETLGLKEDSKVERIYSIWEEKILQLIHPDDLNSKYLQELRFFHFVRKQPKDKQSSFFLMNKLRMKNLAGNYIWVLHRLFYIAMSPTSNNLWLALCLYNPLLFDISAKGIVANAVSGQTIELKDDNDLNILSRRERQVLQLISQGRTSKDIADELYISINTVNRHRQEILNKLQVRNSIEACRIAKEMKII